MILDHPLTVKDQSISQKYYTVFNVFNGFSYMCLGETVILLLAVRVGCPDSVIAVLGSMIYLGFLLLPLGKIMTARSGAAESQANFWIFRNIAALLVASAAPVAFYFGMIPAALLLIIGAFLFYGFRAAGVVMAQPLVGEVCPESKQGSFMVRCWCCFYGSGLLALLLISGVLYWNSNIWVLASVIVAGAVLGLISSSLIRRIRETQTIMLSAREPMFAAVYQACRNPDIIRQMIAGMCCNTAAIMIVPISMLTLKRGYGVSDSGALLYSLAQFAASTAICAFLGKSADRFGGRMVTFGGFAGLCLIPVFWLAAPEKLYWFCFLLPFVLCPAGMVVTVVGLQQYFLRTVPKEQQIAASMVISVATGVISGGLGSVLSTLLLKLAELFSGTSGEIITYRWYFGGVLLLMPVFFIFIRLLRKEITVNRNNADNP